MVMKNATIGRMKIGLPILYDELEGKLRALESLGKTQEKSGDFLTPLVESCLQEEVLIAWERSRSNENETESSRSLNDLMAFLQKEVRSEEMMLLARSGFETVSKERGFHCVGKTNWPTHCRCFGPLFRSLSSPVGRVHGLVFHIAAPPRSALTTATSTGHHPTPFRHAARTVRGKRKSSNSTFYLETASSRSSTTPLPATSLGIAVGHHSSDHESSDRCNLAPQRPPRYQISQFHKKIYSLFPRQTAAVKKKKTNAQKLLHGLSAYYSIHIDAADLTQPPM
ncbi:hypothetical protein AVEN_30036-1 [Araneus ventricosus]|uniref:Uncharacterized protein n=1 Tax=Araneus ventricosus TaxID=182803 RepID=A0A4Y2I6A6_ARAVE|nr:hypothetical protein AVEN_30036-1 [Araneus ventricosus]